MVSGSLLENGFKDEAAGGADLGRCKALALAT
jgi:hypothetical protein